MVPAKKPALSTTSSRGSALVRSAIEIGSPLPLVKYARRLSSGDQEGAAAPWPMNACGVPPVSGMRHFGALESPPSANQISLPSPQKPKVLTCPGGLSGGMSWVRLRKLPVPTCLTQRSICPARSALNATNFPSGEISAPASVPSQSVKKENCAPASGSSWMIGGRRASHAATPAKSAASATQGSAVVGVRARAEDAIVASATGGSVSSAESISSLTSPMSLRRCL